MKRAITPTPPSHLCKAERAIRLENSIITLSASLEMIYDKVEEDNKVTGLHLANDPEDNDAV